MGSKNDGGQAAMMAQAAAEAQRARETLSAVKVSDYDKIADYIGNMEGPELVGLLQSEQLDPSALESIMTNPKYKAAQEKLLAATQEKAQVGLTDAERARRRQLQQEAAGASKSEQAALLQSFAERGMGGQGNELAARLSAQQGSMLRGGQQTDQMIQDIENARMNATAQAAEQAGNLRSQDYGEQSNAARARDAIAQFNAQNRQNVNAQNLSERQRISEGRIANTNLQNQQLAGLETQKFNEAYQKAGGVAQASNNLSQMYMQQAQMAKPKAGLGGAIGTAVGAGAGAYFGGPQGAAAGAQVGGTVGSQFKDGGTKYFNGTPSFTAGGAGVNESYGDSLAPTQKYDRAMAGFAQNREDELDRLGGDPYAAAMYGKKDRSTSEALDAFKNSPVGQPTGLVGSRTESPTSDSAASDVPKTEGDSSTSDWLKVAGQLGTSLAPQQTKETMASFKPQYADLRQGYAYGGVKKGMAYEDGGEGTIIPGDSYSGDMLPDRINSKEAVHNVEQQDRLNDLMLELKRLKQGKRTDEMLDDGEKEVNPEQQQALMEVVRGDRDVEELPNRRVVEDPESGGMARLLEMLSRKR